MAELTRMRQRAYSDKNMSAKVASALSMFALIMDATGKEEGFDLTDILDSVRMNPDIACAYVLAALAIMEPDTATIRKLNATAAAIRTYVPSPDMMV